MKPHLVRWSTRHGAGLLAGLVTDGYSKHATKGAAESAAIAMRRKYRAADAGTAQRFDIRIEPAEPVTLEATP